GVPEKAKCDSVPVGKARPGISCRAGTATVQVPGRRKGNIAYSFPSKRISSSATEERPNHPDRSKPCHGYWFRVPSAAWRAMSLYPVEPPADGKAGGVDS